MMLSENQKLVGVVVAGVATTGILASCVSPDVADSLATGIKKAVNKISGVQPTNLIANTIPVDVLNDAKDALEVAL